MVLSRSLKSSTDNSPSGSKRDCLDTTITIPEGTTNQAANKSTEIVDRDNTALEKRVINNRSACCGILVTKLHRSLVVVHSRVDTTHHSLVVTKEENGESGNAVDCNQKTTLLQLMDNIITRDSIHGGVQFKDADLLEYWSVDRERMLCPACLQGAEAEECLQRERVKNSLDQEAGRSRRGYLYQISWFQRVQEYPTWGNMET